MTCIAALQSPQSETAQQCRHTSNSGASAALINNGSVVLWGNPNSTGNPSQEVLDLISSDVEKIISNGSNWAVLKTDGSVITWGSTFNFDQYVSLIENELLSGVVDVFSSSESFAAIKEDGSVVTWGNSECGGDRTDSFYRRHLL